MSPLNAKDRWVGCLCTMVKTVATLLRMKNTFFKSHLHNLLRKRHSKTITMVVFFPHS